MEYFPYPYCTYSICTVKYFCSCQRQEGSKCPPQSLNLALLVGRSKWSQYVTNSPFGVVSCPAPPPCSHRIRHLSLSRFNHVLPRGEDEPSMMEGTAEVPHQSADVHLPEAAAVFDAATALDTALARVDPQPTRVERLVRHVLLPPALLPQIEINSIGL